MVGTRILFHITLNVPRQNSKISLVHYRRSSDRDNPNMRRTIAVASITRHESRSGPWGVGPPEPRGAGRRAKSLLGDSNLRQKENGFSSVASFSGQIA